MDREQGRIGLVSSFAETGDGLTVAKRIRHNEDGPLRTIEHEEELL